MANCPICHQPVRTPPGTPSFRPFCSRRCAQVDLGRWLTGGYAIPDTAEEEDPLDLPEDLG